MNYRVLKIKWKFRLRILKRIKVLFILFIFSNKNLKRFNGIILKCKTKI